MAQGNGGRARRSEPKAPNGALAKAAIRLAAGAVSPLELLESRQLLSAAPTIKPSVQLTPSAASGSTVTGYTPAQIRTAYGFNNISFSGTTGDGSGQTIAIVDAYNDPNIKADLGVFDSQFGLAAPPSFSIVSQTGSSTLPATDASWAQETSLDVEWAHAIAPGANILLVETKDDALTDLVKGVNYARSATGVSVVSMSWGSSEFKNESSYDKYFTTPTGHAGVTFVAAAGDDGADGGAEWPACSPNVVAVGGTTLNLSSSNTISSETTWDETSGGTSTIEPTPTYQSTLGVTGRTTADVSYDADPNTGFATYDSLSYEGEKGWAETGGTSAGTPQWAALIAIADQGRATKGLTSLDGATGTLPAIYNVYNSATSYAADFNDITTGSNASNDGGGFGGGGGGGGGYGGGGGWGGGGGGHYHGGGGRYGGYRTVFAGLPFDIAADAARFSSSASTTTSSVSATSATTGYDIPTGVGTPKAASFIASLLSAGVTKSSKAAAIPKAAHAIKAHHSIVVDPPPSQQTNPPPAPPTVQQQQPVVVSETPLQKLPTPAIDIIRTNDLAAAVATAAITQPATIVAFDTGITASATASSGQATSGFLTASEPGVVNVFAQRIERTAAAAAATVTTAITDDAKVIGAALKPVAETIAPELFSITHIDASATFADALSNFADESAAMPTFKAVAKHSNARAWMLTGLVLAADVAIIHRYRKQRAANTV